MSRSVIITRRDLGKTPMQLWQPGRYVIPDGTFGGGETSQRRVTSESPQVNGRYASSIVEGSRTGNLSVHVIADRDTLQAEVQLLIDAMSQFRYTLTWEFDGLGGVWQCEQSDWALGESGTLDAVHLKLNTQIVHFVIPHNRISGF